MNMKQTANWQSEIDQSGGSDSVLDISIDDVHISNMLHWKIVSTFKIFAQKI